MTAFNTLTTQQKLDQAQEAYHLLMTGELEVTVSRNGKATTYNMANANQLQAYINSLETLLNPNKRRRALRVTV
jgi:hypothetical protein